MSSLSTNLPIVTIDNVDLYINDSHILKQVTLDIRQNSITTIMGPSGSGKTNLIRAINRLSELVPNLKITGTIKVKGQDILRMNPIVLRRQVGMVFQKPNPFPQMSVQDNVLSGFILNGIKLKAEEKARLVEEVLKKVSLFEEVKDRLDKPASTLSGGQKQRLCFARALALEPSVLLLDEPTSALDAKSIYKIEEMMHHIKDKVTIIMVTHNMQQASRVSDYVAFLNEGELVEYNTSEKMFTNPDNPMTEDFLSRRNLY